MVDRNPNPNIMFVLVQFLHHRDTESLREVSLCSEFVLQLVGTELWLHKLRFLAAA